MEKLFEKIKKYKDSVDGPFFCILSDAHATASLARPPEALRHEMVAAAGRRGHGGKEMMRCPSNSIAHRDCCIGVSFPLVALEKYPDWKKKPARLIEVQKALMEIQGLLEVGALTAGERRDMQAACEAAADAIDAYDAAHSQTRDEAYSAWLVMWFLGDEAFADALFYGGNWKKRPELWIKAKHLIGLTSDRLYLHHQREAEEAARIWHCHASPRKNPKLEDIWKS